MKLSYNWLNDYADFHSIPFKQIVEKISLSICEVDDIEEYKEHLKSIVSVKISEISKHPNADKLSICKCFDGKKDTTIVTAATNVKVGDIVPLALPGTNIDGKLIQEAPLKGVMSYGMFCSDKELGFAEESSGVKILDSNTQLGLTISKLLDLEDKILTIDNKSITHRPDLWSHFGFARELASQLNLPLKFSPVHSEVSYDLKEKLKIITNTNAHSYYANIIKNVVVTTSSPKIKTRLEKCGVRSINNIVDISNYVMLELGQPTHFFDKKTLPEISIEVAFGSEGESLALLDGTTKELNNEILLIRNMNEPIAIAGVMGGEQTSVKDKTTELILESAVFRREDIRKSIKKTGIRSEASIRYEKGLDSYISRIVINRSLELLKENGCPDLIASEPVGFNNTFEKKVEIKTTFSFINKKLGKHYEHSIIINILERLGFNINTDHDTLKVVVPQYRHNYDVTIPEDLVEEVGRSLGYITIEKHPFVSEVIPQTKNFKRELERNLKSIFCKNLDFNEVYNYSFNSKTDITFEDSKSTSIQIANTMPPEYSNLRTSIYPSLIRNVISNIDRFENIKIFEYGRTYHPVKNEKLPNEKKWFGFAIFNNRKQNDPHTEIESDFLNSKNEIESIFYLLNIPNFECRKSNLDYFHPNACIQYFLNGVCIGEIGYLHPKKADEFGLKKRLILGKIYFDDLFKVTSESKNNFRFKTPSPYPQGEIDLSIVMDKSEDTSIYKGLVSQNNISEISEIYVVDVYTGDKIAEGKKSVTYRFTLMNYEKTFTQERTGQITNMLIEIAKGGNYSIR